jgi:hypothetical protein
MEKVSIIGLDLAKRRLQAHGARADGGVASRRASRWLPPPLSHRDGAPRHDSWSCRKQF